MTPSLELLKRFQSRPKSAISSLPTNRSRYPPQYYYRRRRHRLSAFSFFAGPIYSYQVALTLRPIIELADTHLQGSFLYRLPVSKIPRQQNIDPSMSIVKNLFGQVKLITNAAHKNCGLPLKTRKFNEKFEPHISHESD